MRAASRPNGWSTPGTRVAPQVDADDWFNTNGFGDPPPQTGAGTESREALDAPLGGTHGNDHRVLPADGPLIAGTPGAPPSGEPRAITTARGWNEGTTPGGLVPLNRPTVSTQGITQNDAPAPMQAFTEQFTAPGAEGMAEDPGYMFRLGEGEKALQRSALARGKLLTGGTAKALTRYGQGVASQEYGNVYARRKGEFDTRAGLHMQNERNRFDSARTNRTDSFGMRDSDRRFASDETERGRIATERDRRFDFDVSRDDYNRGDTDRRFAWGVEGDRFNMGRAVENDYYGRMFRLADYGFGAAGGVNAAGDRYAGEVGDLTTGAGNANAAGRIGSGNAWQAGLSAVGNAGQNIALSQLSRPTGNYWSQPRFSGMV